MRSPTVVVAAGFAFLVATASWTGATFPGDNGPLVVARIQNGGWALVSMEANGSDAKTIRHVKGFRKQFLDADWSKDARWLAVWVSPGGIEIVRADGSRVRQLVKDADSPSWAPNGRRLAVARFFDTRGSGTSIQVLIVSRDGNRIHRFAGGRRFRTFAPAWSPDGSAIAFLRQRGFSLPLHLVIKPVDGGSSVVVELPMQLEWGDALEWAPDGSALTFIGNTCSGDCADVWRVDADGSNLEALTKTSTAVETDAGWSPDGSTIAFLRWTDAGFEDSDLWFMDVDGSNKTPLRTPRHEHFVDWASA